MWMDVKLVFFCLLSFLFWSSNAEKEVVELTDENFDQLTSDGRFWLVDFYAPWCGHCKQLAPVLDEVAPLLDGKLTIGTLDATKHKKVANRFGIRGFPTLKFTRGGEFFDYDGARTKQSIQTFAHRMTSASVSDIQTVDQLDYQLEEKGYAFIFGDDGKSEKLYQIFLEISKKLQQTTDFFRVKGEEMSTKFDRKLPFIAKVERDTPHLYYENMEKLTVADLENWIVKHNHPLISNFDSQNFWQLISLNKLLAIYAIDFSDSKQKEFVTKLTKSMKNAPQNAIDDFIFGFMDGVRFKNYLSQYGLGNDLPKFFIADHHQKIYYEDPEVNDYDEIIQFMNDVSSGKVKPSNSGISNWIKNMFGLLLNSWQIWVVIVVPILMAITLLLCLRETPEETISKKKLE